MTKSVDWAVNKDEPVKPNGGNDGDKGGNKQAGKGDAPRHKISKWDAGYEQIKWRKK